MNLHIESILHNDSLWVVSWIYKIHYGTLKVIHFESSQGFTKILYNDSLWFLQRFIMILNNDLL